MKVVFLGTPAVAVPCLRALLAAGHRVEAVVSQPDRPVGRSRTPVPTPVKQAALEHDLQILQPRKVRGADFPAALCELEADLLVVVAYGRILTRRVLDSTSLGAINVHFSLLPRYRGAAPVQWALAHGERITGVTTMQMNEQLDEGDILLRQEVPILEDEHAPELQGRLAEVGASLLVETLHRLEPTATGARSELTPEPQDHDAATFAPLLSREDGEVGPDRPAAELEGRVRGFDPWPGVWMRRGTRRIRIIGARARPGECVPDAAPGTILEFTPDGLVMACTGGELLLLTAVQPEGKRKLSARDAVNGRLLSPGDRLEGGVTR